MRLLHPGNDHGGGRLWRTTRTSETEVREALKGNICRCTGYHNIVKAIRSAASQLGGASMSVLGQPIRRREDPALITGKGKYTDDIVRPGQTYAVIVRSPYAHARIKSIDAAAALALPGVLAVFTGHDIADKGGVVPTCWLLPNLQTPAHPILAKDIVRHVGDGVAVVVAEDRYLARDAADLVNVDYEPLAAVADPRKAAAAGAPLVHAEVPGNIAFDWNLGDEEKPRPPSPPRRTRSRSTCATTG